MSQFTISVHAINQPNPEPRSMGYGMYLSKNKTPLKGKETLMRLTLFKIITDLRALVFLYILGTQTLLRLFTM